MRCDVVANNIGMEVWKSLKNDIEMQIITGVYKGGDRLPSVVELMSTYGVSRGTVQKTLSALNNENIIISRGVKGIFVMPFVRDILFNKHKNDLRERYEAIVKEAQALGINVSDLIDTSNKEKK